MDNIQKYEVIIVGGSYSGLAAAMTLGRALRKVLIVDAGEQCNRQTPFSHNFLTQDGISPRKIIEIGRNELDRYATIEFKNDFVESIVQQEQVFQLQTAGGKIFFAEKIVFATGISDQLPRVDGFADCWGISILHCPYCHGYEVSGRKTGVLANGDAGFEYVSLISNWTKDLTVFTNGKSTFTDEQLIRLKSHQIEVKGGNIEQIKHHDGKLEALVFDDQSDCEMDVLYFRTPFVQSCSLPVSLGCELTNDGYIKIDAALQTTINGIYACGDNSSPNRTVSNAVATGHKVGMSLNKEIIRAAF